MQDGNESTVLQININKVFSAEDYELVFFDENETEMQCNLAKNTPGIKWKLPHGM